MNEHYRATLSKANLRVRCELIGCRRKNKSIERHTIVATVSRGNFRFLPKRSFCFYRFSVAPLETMATRRLKSKVGVLQLLELLFMYPCIHSIENNSGYCCSASHPWYIRKENRKIIISVPPRCTIIVFVHFRRRLDVCESLASLPRKRQSGVPLCAGAPDPCKRFRSVALFHGKNSFFL